MVLPCDYNSRHNGDHIILLLYKLLIEYTYCNEEFTSNFPIRSKLPMNGLGLGPGMPCFVKTVYGAHPNLL